MQYDIMIIGSGMVGASLACALRETNLRIALIDASPLSMPDDPRLIALNDNSYCLFKNLGIWENLIDDAAPIKQVHVSDRGHFGKVRITATELGLLNLGYVVPAKNINAALEKTLEQCPHIEILRPAKLVSLTQHQNDATVVLETPKGNIQLTATLIVGADGTNSTVRQLLHIETQQVDYQQNALVTITELQHDHQSIAYERFHQTGAVAMLPLTGLRVATIWTDTKLRIEELMQLSDAEFLLALQQQFGFQLGRLMKISQRHFFPLQMCLANETLKEHVILIGNAAHTFNPIAAQGLNLALAEIAMLAQTIIAQAKTLATPHWQNYLAWQKQQQTNSLRLSKQLPRIFSDNFMPVNIARQLGMMAVNLCPPLKRRFARKAMGKTPLLPSLLIDQH